MQRLWIDCTEAPDAAAPGSRNAEQPEQGWLCFAPSPLTRKQELKYGAKDNEIAARLREKSAGRDSDPDPVRPKRKRRRLAPAQAREHRANMAHLKAIAAE